MRAPLGRWPPACTTPPTRCAAARARPSTSTLAALPPTGTWCWSTATGSRAWPWRWAPGGRGHSRRREGCSIQQYHNGLPLLWPGPLSDRCLASLAQRPVSSPGICGVNSPPSDWGSPPRPAPPPPPPAPQSGKFYRWRLAWATPKRFASLVILGHDGQPAPCEMQLISKDGVYLMQARRGGGGGERPGAWGRC